MCEIVVSGYRKSQAFQGRKIRRGGNIYGAMMLGCGYPMGPFTLLDYVGLDTTMWAAEAIYNEYKDPLYAPPPLLRRMVQSGMYGKKSGRGFYTYE